MYVCRYMVWRHNSHPCFQAKLKMLLTPPCSKISARAWGFPVAASLGTLSTTTVAQLRLQSRHSKDVKGKCFIKVQNGAAPDNPGPAQPGSNAAGSKAPALGMAAQLVLCLTSYRSTDADSRRESCKK